MKKKPPCCRRIFPEDEAVVQLPEAPPAMEDEGRQQMEKWNFDFTLGVPLEGKWEWERLAPSPRPNPGMVESNGGGAAGGAAEEPGGAAVEGNTKCVEGGVKREGEGVEKSVQEEQGATPGKANPDGEHNN